MSLLDLIYNFYSNYVFYSNTPGSSLVVNFLSKSVSFGLSGGTIPVYVYLSSLASIISVIVIVVLCCLFIKKMFNVVSHVIG